MIRNNCIVIITNGNYFARLILERLLIERTNQVGGIVLIEGDYSGRTGVSSLWHVGRRTALPYTAYKLLQYLMFRVAQKWNRHAWLEVGAMARDLGIPCMRAIKVNSVEVYEWLRARQPALGVSVSCPQRIRAKLLNLPERGFVNIHSSLLPAYAGLAPYFWVLAENQPQTGITVHYMTEEFDAGNILVQRAMPVPPAISAFELFRQLSLLGRDALMEAVDLALQGVHGTPQNMSCRSYRSHPTWAAYRSLRRNGFAIARFGELYRAIRDTLQQQRQVEIPQVSRR